MIDEVIYYIFIMLWVMMPIAFAAACIDLVQNYAYLEKKEKVYHSIFIVLLGALLAKLIFA